MCDIKLSNVLTTGRMKGIVAIHQDKVCSFIVEIKGYDIKLRLMYISVLQVPTQ